MEAPPFFDTETDATTGITYYIIPRGTSLFRGDIPPVQARPLEHISGPVFFGQTAAGVLRYGIPFEFVTNSEIRLLALDKSMQQIYINAENEEDETLIDGEPANIVIPSILKTNYAYDSGIRNSANAADTTLANYICKRFLGYATDFMTTDANGKFHREIVIYDKNSVNFVKKITDVNGKTVNEAAIIAKHRKRKTDEAEADARKKAKIENRPTYTSSKTVGMKLSFGDFGDSDEEGGGKSRKRTKSHKKQMRNKRRKTHKKGKPKNATHKRK